MKIYTEQELDSQAPEVFRNTATTLNMQFRGLKANTTYSLTINGVEYGFLAKPFGGDLGDPLVSNTSGQLVFSVLYEVPYEGSYSYDALEFNNDKAVGVQTKPNNYHQTVMTVSISDGTKTFSKMVPLKILVTPGHTNRSEYHGH